MSDPVELRVSSAPFWHDGSRVSARNGHIMLALLVPVAAGMIRHGLPAVIVVGMSLISAVLWELAMNIVTRRRITVFDGNAAMTGLLLSMLLPAVAPSWLVIVLTFIAVVVIKGIYQKTGIHPFNPVVVTMALLLFLQRGFPGFDGIVLNGVYGLVPASRLAVGTMGQLMGHQPGGLGATFGLGLVVGGVYLMLRGYIRWEISLSFLAGIIVSALCYPLYQTGGHAWMMHHFLMYHLLGGYSLAAAFFLATDDKTSPVHFIPMLLYGLLGGALTVFFRNIGFLSEGAIYAVLVINLLNPVFDRIRPRAIYQALPEEEV